MTNYPAPQLQSLKASDSSLDFGPYTLWPAGLPAIAINGLVIAGFGNALVFNHQVNGTDEFAKLFHSVHPTLSTPELSRLLLKSKLSPFPIPMDAIFTSYGIRLNSHCETLAARISSLSLAAQKFAAEKSWSFGDFQPMLAFDDAEFLFEKLMALPLTRQQSSEAFELLVELSLLGREWNAIAKTTPDRWLRELRKLRYPEALSNDEKAAELVSKIHWPGKSTVRWVR